VSSSSASSGIPGPGYLSGKAIKWIGEKVLEAYASLEIRRRMWVIGRLMKRLEKEPEETRWKWLLQREKSVNRLVDDLLELSTYGLSSESVVIVANGYYRAETITNENIERRQSRMALALIIL
jgi:hypothetical protein